MLGLDVIGADVVLGISWGDVGDAGKAAFPYVHATGKGIATAFGAGQAAQALENVEQKQGWLPATPSSSTAAVTASAEKVATAATPKLHPGVSPMTPQKQTPNTPAGGKPAELSKPSKSSQFGTTTIVVGAGVLGIIALIVRRLLGAH